MTSPLIVSVAPNGARKTKSDHPNLAMTPDEIAAEAKKCLDAGAALIHLHVRDEDGNHSIDPKYYRPAIQAIKDAIGDQLIIQATSEACGIYNAKQQMDMVRELKPESVSLAIKEIIPDTESEAEAKEFLKWLSSEPIIPQYILYSAEELIRFFDLKSRGVIPEKHNFVLFVLGRYSEGQTSHPEDLLPFLTILSELDPEKKLTWGVCAFGKSEAQCMQTATLLNGHVRIGFENNMHMVDGNIAENNAALINQFCDNINISRRKVANATEARKFLLDGAA